MLLNSGVTQALWLVFECKLWFWNTNSRWVTNSQPKACGIFQGCHVRVQIQQLWNHMGVPWLTKTGGTKKRGKRVHWVICGEYIGFDKAPWLCVQVEIHIRGLSVWSMSRGVTTAGEVSWQTGPGHWRVLRTSLHSYINRIKTSNWGLFWAFRREN